MSLPPRELIPPLADPPSVDVRLDAQVVVAHMEELASDEVLSLELQLVVTFEVLHHLRMAEKNRSLFAEELDLVEFLVAQVALLSSSLMIVVVGETAFTMSLAPPLATHEVVAMQPDHVVSSAHPPVVVHALVVIAQPCGGLGALGHWFWGVLQGEAA
jgi:hypothetical protein